MTRQEQAIATIKEKIFSLKSSNTEQSFKLDLTSSELLENFIEDLVGGIYSNGSCEIDYVFQKNKALKP